VVVDRLVGRPLGRRLAVSQHELPDLRDGDDDQAGSMQISHWLPLSSSVSRMRWKKRSSVPKVIAATDISDATRNVRSLIVSRLKTERSASRAVNEKNRSARNVVSPIVRARLSPSASSAPAARRAWPPPSRRRRRRTTTCLRGSGSAAQASAAGAP